MPKRTDIESILLIGSGPIVIGQACEFDYSGTQACRVLREEGYRVILVNSNPATIMTDPDFADATYVEPLTVDSLARVIERERPDALLPTLGGQTALNLAIALDEAGVLAEFDVELIGASIDAIHTAEDRSRFKTAMVEIGLNVPISAIVLADAEITDDTARINDGVERSVIAGKEVGFPLICRPSFILGGGGTGFAYDETELRAVARRGLAASPVEEILLEQSVLGWKEYELEVMRDHADNVVVICAIENVDAMGVHTGDSITVAPAQTLTDVEYQKMRDAAFACIRRVGVETGGSNVQFGLDPTNGQMVIIEMNPRVSRSSALASKATGFPIAKIAAKLAVGYRLDEVVNDITRVTPASFEPTIDYVVTKIPRWAFEKLPGADPLLGTMMQSVGEVMAIGRTFPESLQKALRSLESGRPGLDHRDPAFIEASIDDLERACRTPTPDRLFAVGVALGRGITIERLHDITGIDPWFLDQMAQIVEAAVELEGFVGSADLDRATWRWAKRLGFGDGQLADFWNETPELVRAMRRAAGVEVTYKTVDTCAAEFDATTPYHYGTYEDDCEVTPLARPAVVILGSGPNRIGQGVEFDYCCVHAAFALSDAGFETVMVNCNPETVSTDYDTSDRLFFEPLSIEGVLNVCDALQARGELRGVVVALGGQTPLKLAHSLAAAGIPVVGTSPESIDLAEDRDRFNALCDRLEIPQPAGGTATSVERARAIATEIGYPVLVRPSYVLGGRAMQIVFDEDGLDVAMAELAAAGSLGREGGLSATRPALIDRFLEDAIEVDVDSIRDHTGEVLIGGIMEHIEEAGVHSGDSACVLPPSTLSAETIATISEYTERLATALDVCGFLNVQYAVKGGDVLVIEANPRASRTVPFVSKATGVPLAKVAARVMLGASLAELRTEGLLCPPAEGGHVSVKEAVLPFNRFPTVDTLLGPEMRSTGEVMGIDRSFGLAFMKSQAAAGSRLPETGKVFLSLADRDKEPGLVVAARFVELGFGLVATAGTAAACEARGIPVETVVAKVGDANGEDAIGLISTRQVDLVVNTPRGRGPRADGAHIRRCAVLHNVPCLTTVAAALAAAAGIAESQTTEITVRSLQEYHADGQLRLEV